MPPIVTRTTFSTTAPLSLGLELSPAVEEPECGQGDSRAEEDAAVDLLKL